MMRQTRVDWFRVFADLHKGALLTMGDVEKLTGIPSATMQSWRPPTYCEPRHWAGEEVIRLWVVVTGEPRERLPRQMIELRRGKS